MSVTQINPRGLEDRELQRRTANAQIAVQLISTHGIPEEHRSTPKKAFDYAIELAERIQDYVQAAGQITEGSILRS